MYKHEIVHLYNVSTGKMKNLSVRCEFARGPLGRQPSSGPHIA
jgi:hypothetical protein